MIRHLSRRLRRELPDTGRVILCDPLRLLSLAPSKEARLVLPHVPASRQDWAVFDPDDLLVHKGSVLLPDRFEQGLLPAGVPAVPRRGPRDRTLDSQTH